MKQDGYTELTPQIPHWPEQLDEYAAEEFAITFQANIRAYMQYLEDEVSRLTEELGLCREAHRKYVSGDE